MTAPTLTRPATRPAMCPNPAAHMHPHPVPVTPELPAISMVVRRLRRKRGLSQTECAELIGYSASWLSQVERGERGIDSVRALRELARVLDVDVHRLIEVVL
ncbi:helix-turn-helix domain-containing protein [Actinoplanes sp. NPDC051411]|uniref:helix-turn-helix domain-containing protein n=1 Tax=Actinoplanes sp. NPDC051411 TaxID=3155522 RepID=UPI003427ECEB